MNEEMTQETSTRKPQPKKAPAKTSTKAKTKTTRKAAPPKKTTAKVNAKSASKAGIKNTASISAVSTEDKYRMICEEAYYIAEKRGFAGGDPKADWVEAERKINKQ